MTRKINISTFHKNFLTLLSGNGIAHIIPILILPILSRLYSAEDFGVLGNFLATVSLFSIIAAGRYEQAIMLPKENRSSISIIKLGLTILFGVTFVSIIVSIFFRTQIAGLFKADELINILPFLPLFVLGNGIYMVAYYWLNREKKFKKLAFSKVLQIATIAIVNLFFGWLAFGAKGLIIGNISGIIMALFIFRKEIFFLIRELPHIARSEIKKVAIKYSDFPKINLFHAFSDVAMQQFIFNVTFTSFFGLSAMGLYQITYKYIRAPIRLFNASLSQVFYQEASALRANGKNFTEVFFKTIKITSIFALPLFIGLVVLGPVLFGFVLGQEWYKAGIFARMLAPAICLNFIVSPVSTSPIVANRQKYFFLLSLSNHIMSLLVLFLSHKIFEFSAEHSLLAYSLTLSFFYVVMLFWFYRLSTRFTE